jgi:sulfur carrier protein ThiS
MAVHTGNPQFENNGANFVEFRRKVREAEILSAAMEQLLRMLEFSGRLCVVVQNGRVLKSGYEEGYFRNKQTK